MHTIFYDLLFIKDSGIIKRYMKVTIRMFTISSEIRSDTKEMLYFRRVNKCKFLSNAGHNAS